MTEIPDSVWSVGVSLALAIIEAIVTMLFQTLWMHHINAMCYYQHQFILYIIAVNTTNREVQMGGGACPGSDSQLVLPSSFIPHQAHMCSQTESPLFTYTIQYSTHERLILPYKGWIGFLLWLCKEEVFYISSPRICQLLNSIFLFPHTTSVTNYNISVILTEGYV